MPLVIQYLRKTTLLICDLYLAIVPPLSRTILLTQPIPSSESIATFSSTTIKKPVPGHKKIVNNDVSHYSKDPSGLTKLIHTFQKLEASSKRYLEWSSDTSSSWAIHVNDNTPPDPPDMRPVTVSLYRSSPVPKDPNPSLPSQSPLPCQLPVLGHKNIVNTVQHDNVRIQGRWLKWSPSWSWAWICAS